MTPRAEIEPHLFVVLGGTGDLLRRKLLPALHSIARRHPGKLHLLGVARSTELDDSGYRELCREALAEAGVDPIDTEWCESAIHYHGIGDGDPSGWESLGRHLAEIESAHGLPGNRVFYLALPPGAFAPTIEAIGRHELHRAGGWTRLVVEKPFGRDLASARALNEVVHRWFEERQVYRIDHYLGKETVQNLLVFRFSNMLFESVWNRDRIDRVEITVAESHGVGTRAGYYDNSGALRDMVQNHVTQLVSLIAMEVPTAFEADAVRYEKIKVLRSISPLARGDIAFGQYGPGFVEGERVPGYLEEPGVPPDSTTETFVAMKLDIQTWRWQGVPFFIRTGKRLPKRITRIQVTFRQPPVCLFESMGTCDIQPNSLAMTLQPDESFDLWFDVKKPGEPFTIHHLPLSFDYAEAFGEPPEAYETLLLDVVEGDQTLFVHAEEVEAAWRLYDPLLARPPQVHRYAAGTWGPSAADQLLASHGAVWTPL